MKKSIYLDYAATAPVDKRVVKAMMPYFSLTFGNAMSLHRYGTEANTALEASRKTIADCIHADPEEIYFTSSATESNNLALKGVAFSHQSDKKHIIISSIEHDCVLHSAKWLGSQGFDISIVPVDEKGFVRLDKLKKLLRSDTLLVSIIHGNNEIGTIQDIGAIANICKDAGVYFHTDASQSFSREPIDVRSIPIDLLTASSHKLYGPKGAAILYVRKGTRIEPILHGGGHEKGLRSSTSNIPAIVGMAKAVDIYMAEGKAEQKRITALRNYFIDAVVKRIPGVLFNGDRTNRLANNINVSILGIEGESMVLELDFRGVCVSTGSACSSNTLEPSHVLLAIGRKHKEAHGSLRISLGRFTTKKDIDKAVQELVSVVKKLRDLSPVSYKDIA